MPVRQFRRRPVVLDAMQWTGDNLDELFGFTGGRFHAVKPGEHTDPLRTAQVFDHLHLTWVGVHTGQWILRGPAGEFYPIAESVMAVTYEPVEASS